MDIITGIWKNVVVHVLDVTIVSYLIYRLLLLFRGTRTIQIFLGIVLLFLVTIASKLLGLSSFHWILNQFWLAGMVIVAIIFQQEIRSVLAFLGARPLKKFFVTDNVEFIHEAIAAVRELAANRVGGIIVFERKTGLMNYVESGTILNANVKKELILNLFTPKAPLHDGAVIISNTKLMAAGCVLPLSLEKDIPHGATRHRAALGLSEITDAVILVISEETGQLAMAETGQLRYNVSVDDAEKKLIDVFEDHKKVK
jgi:diadenylate cyclase